MHQGGGGEPREQRPGAGHQDPDDAPQPHPPRPPHVPGGRGPMC